MVSSSPHLYHLTLHFLFSFIRLLFDFVHFVFSCLWTTVIIHLYFQGFPPWRMVGTKHGQMQKSMASIPEVVSLNIWLQRTISLD